MLETLNIKNVTEANPLDIAEFLTAYYSYSIPVEAGTPEELKEVGVLLAEIGNAYAFVSTLLIYAQVDIRNTRRKGNKVHIENAIDRRDVLETFCSLLKMQYSAASRLITVRQQAMSELQMV